MQQSDRSDHWDTYYQGKEVPLIPSQFAVFALGEYSPDTVVDIGCGSGRDSFFFAAQGIRTIGLDGSASAVDLCSSRVGNQQLQFKQVDVKDPLFAEKIQGLVAGSSRLLVYARFFVHAITDDEEDMLLRNISKILSETPGILAVEFRTPRDRSLSKVTPDHYRRFVEPTAFVSRAAGHGLKPLYSAEGFGMAKYKEDDAYVARLIFSGN